MKKWKLLPQMAVKGIISNGIVYYPYLIAGIVAAFAYFVFSAILHNDLLNKIRHSPYVFVLMQIGRVLLGIILFFFLIYVGSFVIKRRKKEIGLYSLLGLEKKHIGMMLFLETLISYGVVMIGGMTLGTVNAKLFFLLLLKLNHLSLNVEFGLTIEAFRETMTYFGIIFLLNFMIQLWEVGKSRPTELLAGSRKGEKEPHLLPLWSVLGVAFLGGGYYFSIISKIDSMLFINFFLAVFLVIIGTYLLFTSGSVYFLKLMRRNRGIYYKPTNFITISGMFYRMKKNAAGLVNICIFSTMVVITLICTVYVYYGMEDVAYSMFPYDIRADYEEGSLARETVEDKLEEAEEEYGLGIQRADLYEFISLSCEKKENCFRMQTEETPYEDIYQVIIMTLADYNCITGEQEELSDGEILIYSTGGAFGYEILDFMGIQCRIQKEAEELFPYPSHGYDGYDTLYVVIARDEVARDAYVRAWAEPNGVEDMNAFLKSGSERVGILLEGTEEERKLLVNELAAWVQMQSGFKSYRDGLEGRENLRAMDGMLLFIGLIFGFIFIVCLIIIMYYKQVAEGYEDRGSFEIMQKVGMSDDEIKRTIHKQILLVFALPLMGALAHTAAGMVMVYKLLFISGYSDLQLMIRCVISVFVIFSLIYAISYIITAKTYYRIVNHAL